MSDLRDQRISWDRFFFDLCRAASARSLHPRCRVGCVYAREDGSVAITGYNDLTRGMPHTPEHYARPLSTMLVVHAEANGIALAAKHGVSLGGTTLYVPWSPCHECARLIVAAGVVQVVTDPSYVLSPELTERYRESHLIAASLFDRAGVHTRQGV